MQYLIHPKLYFGRHIAESLSYNDNTDNTDYNTLKNNYEYHQVIDLEQQTDKTVNRTSSNIYAELLPLFEDTIEKDKIFLRKDLRMESVAKIIRTNRTYVSRLVNDTYNCNFSDYINRKRIEYALMLMESEPVLTQEQIADKSGFIHSSSFSRTFKQQTGKTFREQRKSIITKKN